MELLSENIPQHGGQLGSERVDPVPVLLDGLREGEQGQHADRELIFILASCKLIGSTLETNGMLK